MMISTDPLDAKDVVYKISDAIAEETGTPIDEMPPLYETIDPDALESFLQRANHSDTHPEWSIEFRYCGYRVVFDSTGKVELHQSSASIASTASR